MSIHVSSKGVSYYGMLGTNRQTTTVSSKCFGQRERWWKWPWIFRKAAIHCVESFSIIQGMRRWSTSRPKNCSSTRKFPCPRFGSRMGHSVYSVATMQGRWLPRSMIESGESKSWLLATILKYKILYSTSVPPVGNWCVMHFAVFEVRVGITGSRTSVHADFEVPFWHFAEYHIWQSATQTNRILTTRVRHGISSDLECCK